MLLLTGCAAAAEPEPIPPARAAEPQQTDLGWRESYPKSGEQLHFAVDELTVRSEGWSVEIAVTNETGSSFELGGDNGQLSFGLMLLATGELEELEDAIRAGNTPPVRLPETMEPSPPAVLAPAATWRATLTGVGSLADGSYVRVTFGPLRVVGKPPEGMERVVFWMTDSAYQL